MNIDRYLRKNIKQSSAYDGVDPSDKLSDESGIISDEIIKLNANENPFGSELNLTSNLSQINIHEYPDPNQNRLRKALSIYTGAKFDKIIASSGSDELIDILIRLFLEPDDKLIDAQPTFGMYEFFAKIQGAEVISVRRKKDFGLDLDEIAKLLDNKTKMIFIASPNNPTGNIVEKEELLYLLKQNIIVVVDETYFEFCGKSYMNLIEDFENLIIIRSFSKWAGLAGLRIGYAIANTEIIKRIIQIKQPYNINSAAEFVAIEAMKNKERLYEKVKILMEQKDQIYKFLKNKTGIEVFSSEANFVLCDLGKLDANDVYDGLARKGIFVRKFSNQFIDNSLRISAGTPDQTRRLLQELDLLI
ncbi:MAG: histidinol-phosphate transaminase [Chloroflexi bacterium]|nr:histidinol-phosphate transaminase [Chloroflexota bacterium]|tara:strand:- start:8358 stop:9437 length:1080 start_codon:yes stop_codon:yes gene_type:complete